jgi:hypothetical protein
MNAKQIEAIKDLARSGNDTEIGYWVASFPEFAYEVRQIVAAIKIRQWCRKAGLTTKRGTLHCLDGRYEGAQLWSILGGVSGYTDGITWTCRKVDELRNIYLQF